jgi:predicted lysophospholipase L1 biosynthesis ABC-type transport system permease subunit
VNYCQETRRWAFDPEASLVAFPFRLLLMSGCVLTNLILWIVMFSIPEITLYSMTFGYIIRHTNRTALSGILRPEVIKKRKQQNSLNLMMTFWTWFAQFITNIIYIILLMVFFGRNRFTQAILAAFTVSLNFIVLPLFYVMLADEAFKSAILRKDYIGVVKIFLDF